MIHFAQRDEVSEIPFVTCALIQRLNEIGLRVWLQLTVYRKSSMLNRMVTWPMTWVHTTLWTS